jgi:transposase
LYLHPPEHAIMLYVDGRRQIQALERTQPVRPVAAGRPERRSYDDRRRGTTTLFAALEVATGRPLGECHPRHRHSPFLAFLKRVARAWPREELHLVVDDYATHKHAAVRAWLGKHPRIQPHSTPTYGSWLDLVEVFFAIIERQAPRREGFASVEELVTAVRRFCEGWNDRCQPFVWTRTRGDLSQTSKSSRPGRRRTLPPSPRRS